MSRCFLFLVLVALPLSSQAQGGPPLLTDDPGTPGDGHYEINMALTAASRPGHQEFEAPLIDMNWGITDHGQFKIEIPWAVSYMEGDGTHSGPGEFLIGGKWRFLDQGQVGIDVSTYPQISFSRSSRSKALGLADRGVGYILPVEIAHDFGKYSVGMELGYIVQTARPDQSFTGLVFAYKANELTEWLAEYHQVFSRRAEDRQRLINVGLRRQLAPHLRLLASMGADPVPSGPDPTRFTIYLGLQFSN